MVSRESTGILVPLHGNVERVCRIVHRWGKSFTVYAESPDGEAEVDLGFAPEQMQAFLRKHSSALSQIVVPLLFMASGKKFDSWHGSGDRTTVWFREGYRPLSPDPESSFLAVGGGPIDCGI